MNLDSLPFLGIEKFTHKTLCGYLSGSLSSSANSNWKGKFLQVSKGLKENLEYSTETTYGEALEDALVGTSFTKKEELGFIVTFLSTRYKEESIPTESMDIFSYVDAALTYEEYEFEARYGEFEPVMEKYRMVKDKLEKSGYLFERN